MSMSNREITALEREAKSREDLARAIKSDKGKEYLREREALEKAAGGKKKLDDAARILVDAQKAYDNRIAEAETKAKEILEGANVKIQQAIAENAEKARVLANVEAGLDRDRAAHTLKVQELNNAVLAVKERETRTEAREMELSQREADIAMRERAVEARENKADELDRWANARPV